VPDQDFPFLRGHISATDRYQSPQGGGGKARLPARDAPEHSRRLRQQLAALAEAAAARREGGRDPAASHEIVAVRGEEGYDLKADSLGDRATGVRFVARDPDTGVSILDAADPTLKALEKKVTAYGDTAKQTKKGRPRNEPALAPMAEIRLAGFDDLAGPRLRELVTERSARPHWTEAGCRGGTRRPPEESERSRLQIQRQLRRLDLAEAREFATAEQLVLYFRCTVEQLRALLDAVDCVYEVEVVEPVIRDWLIGEDPPVRDIADAAIHSPNADAPAIVILDTGIATRHPLLRSAILSADSVIPENASPEDTHGHGTQVSGVALHGEGIGDLVDDRTGQAEYFLQSVKVLEKEGQGAAAEANRVWWPERTKQAVAAAEAHDATRPRAFVSAVTAEPQEPGRSLWSTAIDQLAFGDERQRLICVAAGNAGFESPGYLDGYPTLGLTSKIQDPAQSFNALTVGSFTSKVTLPPDPKYADGTVVAPVGGVCPSTCCGPVGGGEAMKPDVVFEGGNIARYGVIADHFVPTLCTLSTGHEHLTRPLSWIAQTSEAVARAGRLAGLILTSSPDLRPETVRGLVVHAAEWTPQMEAQFPNLDERLAACGYGVPDEEMALSCARDRATVLIEDEMPNGLPQDERTTPQRQVKFFRLPVPEEWVELADTGAELRVTLSYFAEPNLARRRVYRGLDLKWDVQGPDETEAAFSSRVNKLRRDGGGAQGGGQPYRWEVGPLRRRRGTVQRDQALVPASLLAGPKLIAISPVLGWWDARRELATTSSMRFSLIVSVSVPDLDVYVPVAAALEVPVEIELP